MKYWSFFLLIGLTILSACEASFETLNVMSFNIRYDNPADSLNSWSNRKEFLTSFLVEQSPDVVGMQEALKHQLIYLDDQLEEYNYVGVGRTDGKEAGEFVPIFYKKSKYELLATSHFWLSNTPDVPGSKSWGAQLPRIVTWVKLKDKQNGYIFYAFNAHLSHVSEYARNESAVLILKKIKSLAGDAPVVLMGDFNAIPSESMYATLTNNWQGHLPLWDVAIPFIQSAEKENATFNGFNDAMDPIRIDYIFANGFFNAINYVTHQIKSEGMFISDHYPIQVELEIGSTARPSEKPAKKLAQSLSSPEFVIDQFIFDEHTFVPLKVIGQDAAIYYTLDGTEPDSSSIYYEKPIILDKSATVTAKAFSEHMHPSQSVSRTFIKKRMNGMKIKEVIPDPDTSYSSGTYSNLVDYTAGSSDLKDGSWTGFNGTDVDIICEFPKARVIEQVHLSVLSDPGKWIITPTEVKVAVSNNGYEYIEYGGINITPGYDTSQHEQLLLTVNGLKTGKYVKISIYNPGVLPDYHPGAGNPSWVFIDELLVN